MLRTLTQLGIARATFYRWYDLFPAGGPEALEDRPSAPSGVWNRLPGEVRGQIIDMALDETELSPRELAVEASGCDQPTVLHRPRLLSDNGPLLHRRRSCRVTG